MDVNAYVSREDYRRWAEAQPNGRFERVDGRVVRMPAEQIAHIEIKMAVWRSLADAIRAAGLEAQAFGDGVTIEVGSDTDYEPDASVNVGPRPAASAYALPNPVIVVEVLSPGTRSRDMGAKLDGYFRVPSIVHYLMVDTRRRRVRHHRRDGEKIVSTVVTEGEIALEPPGIAITVDDIYRDARL